MQFINASIYYIYLFFRPERNPSFALYTARLFFVVLLLFLIAPIVSISGYYTDFDLLHFMNSKPISILLLMSSLFLLVVLMTVKLDGIVKWEKEDNDGNIAKKGRNTLLYTLGFMAYEIILMIIFRNKM